MLALPLFCITINASIDAIPLLLLDCPSLAQAASETATTIIFGKIASLLTVVFTVVLVLSVVLTYTVVLATDEGESHKG